MALFGAIDWFATRLSNYIVTWRNLAGQPVQQQPLPLRNVFNININQGNRNNQNDVMTVRDHLFHAIYFRVALMYARVFSRPMRRTLEYFILLKALLFFFALVYIHISFIKNPSSCLEHVQDWPRDGVLRVEVVPNLDKRLELYGKTQSLESSMRQLQSNYFYGIGPKTLNQMHNHKFATNETYTYYLERDHQYKMYQNQLKQNIKDNHRNDINNNEQYIVEYSLEYGHLRLSPATRERLRVPVRVVQLDPENNQCFGHKFSKFLLREFLGYDDLLMASVRVIAEKEDNKGYLRNVITSEHFRFVSTWWTAWSSYPTAFFVMLIFTFATSMLLRFSHHQIFLFIVDLLQMLEFNISTHFPIAPLIIVVLALVGMEAIMSEFFNDTTTAFYIIIIVWIADQYYSICCRTEISKRHWVRFFYLYHFAFYAYHHRFSGQNRSLALVSSWLFIQHSMLYFFHRYELPSILGRRHVLRRFEGNMNVTGGGGGAGGGVNAPGVFMPEPEQRVAVREMRQLGGNRMRIITWQRPQQHQPPVQQQPQQEQPQQQLQEHLQQQQLMRNRNFQGVRGLLHRTLHTLRHELFGPAPMRVRVQQTDLQHINLGAIQIIPDQASRGLVPPNPNTATVTTTSNAEGGGHATTTTTLRMIRQTQQDLTTVFISSSNDTATASGSGSMALRTASNNRNNIVSFNVQITTTTAPSLLQSSSGTIGNSLDNHTPVTSTSTASQPTDTAAAAVAALILNENEIATSATGENMENRTVPTTATIKKEQSQCNKHEDKQQIEVQLPTSTDQRQATESVNNDDGNQSNGGGASTDTGADDCNKKCLGMKIAVIKNGTKRNHSDSDATEESLTNDTNHMKFNEAISKNAAGVMPLIEQPELPLALNETDDYLVMETAAAASNKDNSLNIFRFNNETKTITNERQVLHCVNNNAEQKQTEEQFQQPMISNSSIGEQYNGDANETVAAITNTNITNTVTTTPTTTQVNVVSEMIDDKQIIKSTPLLSNNSKVTISSLLTTSATSSALTREKVSVNTTTCTGCSDGNPNANNNQQQQQQQQQQLYR